MKLTLNVFLTLDGVMQRPGRPDEDTTNGFDRGGWMPPFADRDSGAIVDSWYQEADAVLLGSTSFRLLRDYWSTVSDPDNLIAAKLNSLPKYVTSSSITDPNWANTKVITPDDALARIAELKALPGRELQVHGSCALARSLHRAGIIDEYRLLVFPVVVGSGKRLFTEDTQARGLTLVASTSTAAGAVYVRYGPADTTTGSFLVTDGVHGVL